MLQKAEGPPTRIGRPIEIFETRYSAVDSPSQGQAQARIRLLHSHGIAVEIHRVERRKFAVSILMRFGGYWVRTGRFTFPSSIVMTVSAVLQRAIAEGL